LRKCGEMTVPRFLFAGLVNTALTYFLYLGLLLLMPYAWAYSLTYVAGIGAGYLLNAKWVFRRHPSLRTAATYPLTYGVNYAVGLTLLWLLVELGNIPREIAPLIVVAVSTPLMYVLTRAIFHGKPSHETTNNNRRLQGFFLTKG
jgi:putative flippase GtrA